MKFNAVDPVLVERSILIATSDMMGDLQGGWTISLDFENLDFENSDLLTAGAGYYAKLSIGTLIYEDIYPSNIPDFVDWIVNIGDTFCSQASKEANLIIISRQIDEYGNKYWREEIELKNKLFRLLNKIAEVQSAVCVHGEFLFLPNINQQINRFYQERDYEVFKNEKVQKLGYQLEKVSKLIMSIFK